MGEETMRALVARAGRVAIERRDIPVPGYGEVVVKTVVASMCSADPAGVSGSFETLASTVDADPRREPGVVMGHEAVGIVQAVGVGVSGFRIGDRVITSSTTACGTCENCQRGVGGQCRDVVWGGYSFGLTRDGTLAEYFLVPWASFNLAHVPDGVSDTAALFVTDSFASGSSAIEGSSLPFGGSALVIGQGHIGLGATAAARIAGAALVITARSRPGQPEISRAMGADLVLNHAEHDVRAEVLRATGGRGVDLAVEASGSSHGFELAVELTRLGGEVSGVASYTDANGDSLAISLEHWGWGLGDKRIRTNHQQGGSARTGRLLRLIERGRVEPTLLFTHQYDFADAVRALEDTRSGLPGLIKPLIHF